MHSVHRILKFYIPNICIVFLLAVSVGCRMQSSAIASEAPERIVLTWSGDPATSQSVVWRTGTRLDKPLVQWAIQQEHGSLLDDNASDVIAGTEKINTEDDLTWYHYTGRLTGLSPNTVYAYRVGSKHAWSEWNYFRTAASAPTPWKMIYLGDVQNGIHMEWSGLVRKAYARAPDARCMIFAGDLVNRGKHDDEWGEFFSGLSFIARTMPLVPVAGNHDCSQTVKRQDGTRLIDPLYRAHFDLPDNGPGHEDFRETSFYYDIQGVRLIAFNSNSYADPEQLAWLKTTLQQSTAQWNIVVHHHPLFSTGNNRDNKELRALLIPVYEAHHVDLVLQGHDHRYGRTGKILGGKKVADDSRAPVYVVSVSGTKAYKHNKKFAPLMRVEVGDTQCYQVLHVDGATLRYEAWSLDDRLIDSFMLKKDPGGNSVLQDSQP